MSKKKILITMIVIVAIGVAAIILASYKSPVSPGVSEETGGGEPTAGTETPEGAPVTGTGTPEGTSVSGTEVSGGTPVAEEASAEKIEGPGTKELEGMNYRIVYKTEVEGQGTIFDVLTGKINKQKVDLLANKIVADTAKADSEVKKITMNFYSKESLIEEQKVDVAIIDWVPNKTSIKMIEE